MSNNYVALLLHMQAKTGNAVMAMYMLKSAVAAAPKDAVAANELGVVYLNLGRYSEHLIMEYRDCELTLHVCGVAQ